MSTNTPRRTPKRRWLWSVVFFLLILQGAVAGLHLYGMVRNGKKLKNNQGDWISSIFSILDRIATKESSIQSAEEAASLRQSVLRDSSVSAITPSLDSMAVAASYTDAASNSDGQKSTSELAANLRSKSARKANKRLTHSRKTIQTNQLPKRNNKSGNIVGKEAISSRTQPSSKVQHQDESSPVAKNLAIPTKRVGNVKRGAHIFQQGCTLCHGRTAKAITPRLFGRTGWSTFFASGRHQQYAPLDANFTSSELADAKAFLMNSAKTSGSSRTKAKN